MLWEGIIEKSQSPCGAQMLVTRDEGHKRRMVVDYSRSLNKYTPLGAYPILRIHDLVYDLAKYKVFSKLDLKNTYYSGFSQGRGNAMHWF